jgi:hypothetical protein
VFSSMWLCAFRNGKLYFGITCESLIRRKSRHIAQALRGHACRFHSAIRKYGHGKFVWFEIGAVGNWVDGCEVERALISYFDTTCPDRGYNMTAGGEGAWGRVPTHDTRQKISQHLKAWFASEDPRAKEVRSKVSATRKSASTSEATRAKMSSAHKGRSLSEPSRVKLSASKRKYSEDVVRQALTFASNFGFHAAEKQFGIARQVIRRWSWTPEKLADERRKMRDRAKRRTASPLVALMS